MKKTNLYFYFSLSSFLNIVRDFEIANCGVLFHFNRIEIVSLQHKVDILFICLFEVTDDVAPGEVLFEDYIQPAPMPPRGLDLPFQGYVHHDTLAVPGHPYAINVIQTIQPPLSAGAAGVALILALAVFGTQPFTLDDSILGRRLLEMRWLKNKAFFGSITQKALEMFK